MAGVINTSQSFANGDSVTSTKLNAIATGSYFTSDAVTGTGLTVTTGGLLSLGIVASSNMGANSVLTASIAAAQVTPAKLSSGGPSWDTSSSTTGSGVTGTYSVNFTPARTGDGDTTFNIGSQTSTSTNSTITRKSGVNGTFDFLQTGTGAMTFTSTSGGFKFGDAPMPTPSGAAPLYAARAFANFNGGSNSGTFAGGGTTIARSSGSTTCTAACANNHNLLTGHVLFLSATGISTGLYTITKTGDKTFTFTTAASTLITSNALTFYLKPITGSGNVSCITYNGTGLYWVNLLTEMPNSNYSVLGTGARWAYNSTRSTVAFDFASINGSGNGQDYDPLNFVVFA